MNTLPPEIVQIILVESGELSVNSIMSFCHTNRQYLELCDDPKLWLSYIPILESKADYDNDGYLRDLEDIVNYEILPIVEYYQGRRGSWQEFAGNAFYMAVRSNKIIIITHILDLIILSRYDISEFYQLIPTLVKNGHLFVVNAILFAYPSDVDLGAYLASLYRFGYSEQVPIYFELSKDKNDAIEYAVMELTTSLSRNDLERSLREFLKLIPNVRSYREAIVEGVHEADDEEMDIEEFVDRLF